MVQLKHPVQLGMVIHALGCYIVLLGAAALPHIIEKIKLVYATVDSSGFDSAAEQRGGPLSLRGRAVPDP